MDPTNLLLIEGDEKSHYTWIKNYNRLLSYDLSNQKVFCPYLFIYLFIYSSAKLTKCTMNIYQYHTGHQVNGHESHSSNQ